MKNSLQTNNQLLQYVGIGKTQIIRVIQDYFLKIGKEQKLKITAYIANAALLKNGTTIHFLLELLINKCTIINKPYSIINIWPNI